MDWELVSVRMLSNLSAYLLNNNNNNNNNNFFCFLFTQRIKVNELS